MTTTRLRGRTGATGAAVLVALVLLVALAAAPPERAGAAPGRSLAPFRGMGTWADVYDWSNRYGGANPAVGPESVDRMAQVGVTTLYLQTTTPRAGVDLLEPERLRAIVDRAKARGIAVVGWYVPTLVDPAVDLRRLVAMTSLGVDAIGVDIEDLSVSDTNERNRRLLAMSAELRATLPTMPLSAITLDAVHLDVINNYYWPAFPWAGIADIYDVIQPMAYWTNRTTASGYRDGYRYIAENMDRIRAHTGRPDVPIHPIGGLSSLATTADLQGMVLAAAERGALGVSLYDFAITPDWVWPVLRLSGGNPVGNLEQSVGGPGSVVVSGWALDPDTTAPVEIHVYVDGVGRANVRADRSRPDVATHFPDWGPSHGFSAQVGGLSPGAHDVCTFAISIGRGSNVLLECRTVTVPSGSPWGRVDDARGGLRSVRVAGWAIDPDTGEPIEVHVYVDGVGRANVRAQGLRPDLARAFPGWGGRGTFAAVVPDLLPGPHDVCTFAIDVGPGENRLLSCRTVTVGNDPGGVLDAPRVVAPHTLEVTGWATDPDTAAPIDVHVYVDGVGRANVVAAEPRADAALAVPSLGDAHGYRARISGLTPGDRQVCAYAINAGPGGTTSLGCRTANVPGGPPIGVFEAVRAGPRSAQLVGWALEPDGVDPVDIHVYVDGIGRANVPADLLRPDIDAAFPGWGANHGFAITVGGLAPGAHQACAYAVDPVAPHPATLLGCREVLVPSGSPSGNVELMAEDPGRPGTVRVVGWTLDPDTADPTEVHVYVDGVGHTNALADRPRSDIAKLWPPWGGAHGFAIDLPGLASGPHAVCVFAIDRLAPGENVLLRCDTVEVAEEPELPTASP